MHRITNTQGQYVLLTYLDSQTEKADQFVVAEPIEVELFDGRVVQIPKGFVSDGHSTPRWLDPLLPHFDAKTNLAAIVHDYLYMHWEEVEPIEQLYKIDYPRSYADEAYHYLMEQMAPGRWRNALYWLAVRLFGEWNWRRFRHDH